MLFATQGRMDEILEPILHVQNRFRPARKLLYFQDNFAVVIFSVRDDMYE